MAAEIRLALGLDLAYFRQEMRKAINIVQSEFTGQINVKINRQSLQRETQYLTSYFRRKNYRINVNTNLDAEIKKARELTQTLANIDRALKAPSVAATRGGLNFSSFLGVKGQGTQVGLADLKKLYKAAADAGLTEYKSAAAKSKNSIVKELEQIGEDSLIGLLNGLNSQEAKVRNAAKSIGKELIDAVKAELGIASPSKKFREIGEDSGEGLEEGLESGIKEAKSVGVYEIRNLFKALQGEARAGAAQLGAIIAGSMSGMIRLPGGREQAGRIRQAGGGINAAMTGAAFGNLRNRQATIRSQVGSASATTPSFLAALPLLMGMNERELVARVSGLYGQSFEAPGMGRGRVMPRTNIINQLAASRGAFGTGGGAISRMFSGGGAAPAISPTGYIGRSALSPQFANYPIGMQGAYVSGGFTGGTPSSRFDFGANIRGLLPSAGMTARQAMFAARTARAQARGGSVGEHFMQAPKGLLPSAEMQSTARTLRDFSAVAAQAMERIRRADAARARGGSTGDFLGAGGRGGGRNQLLLSAAGGGDGGGGGRGLTQRLSGLKLAMAPLQQSRVPLAGAISELSGEFGNAVKQVLLFGTAYKALAFFVNLPAQALEAARSLQSFNNQVNAITGSAANARQAISFINKSVEQFNIPLQSARDGFLKLYASMKPAGISTDVIEGLFTGVSKASATLGLSADQVDRVTYAFSQMASKGKIMSEEVTGQLGDVIPGALSLMADAAGMSMAEFKDAMEEGQLSGAAMEQIFRNLETVFDERFGAGAVGAADTLQGKMNDLQTAVTRMYESFEPLVDLVASSVFPQLSTLIEDATKAVEAFAMRAEGTNPALSKLSSNAQNMYNVLVQLSGIAKSIGELFQSLRGVFGLFGQTLLTLLEGFNALISNPVGQFLVRLTGFAVVANAALATLAVRFAAVSTSLKTLNLMLLTGSQRFGAIRNQMRATGATAGVLRGRILGVSTALKSAFVGTGVGLVLMGLSALAEHMSNVAQRAEEVRRKALGAAEAIRAMGRTEVAQQERQTRRAIGVLESIRGRQAPYEAQSGEEVPISVSKEEVRILEAAGIPVQRAGFAGGGVMAKSSVPGYLQQQQGILAEARHRKDVIKFEESESRKARAQIEKVTLGGGDGEGKGKSAKSKLRDYDRDLSRYYTNIARTESEAIKQRMDLTAREKEIALAVVDFTLKEKLAREQYQRDIAKVNELVVGDREQYLADKKSQLDTELQLAQQEFGTIVLSPFAKRAESEIEAQKELKQSIKALQSGREELTAVEKAEIFIQEALKGVTEEYKDQLTPFIQRLRDAAKETARLSKEEKALIEQRKYDKGPLAEAQNRLRLAGMFDPRAELRERIRQRLGEAATPERIEEQAKLEESAQGLEDMKNAVRGVRDEFAGLFSTMITDSASAQESLAQSFANIGKSFADMAGRMIAQWLFMKAIGMVGNLFGGSGEQGVGPVAKAAGIVPKAGYYGPAFANGGIVKGPTLGLIGEGRFNEAVVPLPNGKSIPVDLGGGTGGDIATSIVVNVNNGQASSSMKGNQGNQLAKNIEGAVKEVIMRETRPGGIIYSSRQ